MKNDKLKINRTPSAAALRSDAVPALSVITPVFNGARFLRECLESVLAQDEPVEHVLVDGGSTDGTLEMLAEYAARYPEHVRYVTGRDRGACDAWNKGWVLARGEVLGWLGADDRMAPGAARVVADAFRKPDTLFVYGETNIIDEKSDVIGRYATADFHLIDAVSSGNGIPAMAAWYRRSLVDAVGALDATINLCDCDFFIRAGRLYRLERIPDTLADFRLHGDNITDRLQRSVYPREDFLISRRHGGGLWTPIARRYYRSVVRQLPLVGGWLHGLSTRQRTNAATRARLFRRVAIFGAALSGQKCFKELTERGVEVTCFIDNNPPPGRCFCQGAVVTPAEWVGEERAVDAVYVASAGRHAEMRRSLSNAGWTGPTVNWG